MEGAEMVYACVCVCVCGWVGGWVVVVVEGCRLTFLTIIDNCSSVLY